MTKLTNSLLTCGIIAGPIYVFLGVLQIIIRPGFDITRHALSIMSNGDLGWIQISNFMLTGFLVIAFAVGLWSAIAGGRGGTFGPILFVIFGIGLIGAGFFKADPALGFPPGTPVDAHGISTSGILHFVFGGIGFYAFIAACFVIARRFSGDRSSLLKWFSIATGLIFFVSFAAIASGSGSGSTQAIIMVSFYIAVLLMWIWISVIAYFIRKALSSDNA